MKKMKLQKGCKTEDPEGVAGVLAAHTYTHIAYISGGNTPRTSVTLVEEK